MSNQGTNTFESETEGLYADDPKYYRAVKKYSMYQEYAQAKNKLEWNKRKTSLQILDYLKLADLQASSLQSMKAKDLVKIWKAAKALNQALKEAGRMEEKTYTSYSKDDGS